MRKNKKDLNAYQNDMVNISNKEQEILESYNEDFIEYDEKVNYDDEEFDYKEEFVEEEKVVVEKPKKSSKKVKEEVIIIEDDEEPTIEETEEVVLETADEIEETQEEIEETSYDDIEEKEEVEVKVKKTPNYKKIINVCFAIIMAILIMVAIDVISVGRYNRGPYFAIQTKEYDDGGTKEYIGFGYKVIEYSQIEGRQGKVIGPLSLQYNTEAIETKDLDLAIEFTADEEAAYKKYYKQYLMIESKLQSMDFDNNTIVFGYIDEGGKYTLKMTCKMASETEELANIDVEQKVVVTGTVTNYEFKTAKSTGELELSGCFARK